MISTSSNLNRFIQAKEFSTNISEEIDEKKIYLNSNSSEDLFLQELLKQGMIDENYLINTSYFKKIKFPSIKKQQIDLIKNIVNEKIAILICNPRTQHVGYATLLELHAHLKNKFRQDLSHPFLMGGLLRFVLTSSLEFLREAFTKAGLENVETLISQEFWESHRCRFPPDGDFKYRIFSVKKLHYYLNEVVSFFSKKTKLPEGVINTGLSNKIVVTPNSEKRAQKVSDFALISFGQASFSVDLVFDRSPDHHEHIFYNLAFDLENLQFGTSNLDCWQALIDILSHTLHIRNPDFWGSEAWPLLLSYHLRGYTCAEEEKINILRQQTILCGVADALKKCLDGHHPKDPWAAFLITLQACFFLRDLGENFQSQVWEDMKDCWQPFLKSIQHPLLKLLGDIEGDLDYAYTKLQTLSLFQIPFLKVKAKKIGEKSWLQFKIFIENQSYYLLLPLDRKAPIEGLKKCDLTLMFDANSGELKKQIFSLIDKNNFELAVNAWESWKQYYPTEDPMEILHRLYSFYPDILFQILNQEKLFDKRHLFFFKRSITNCQMHQNYTTFERLVSLAKRFAETSCLSDQPFSKEWKLFFDELDRQDRLLEKAELLSGLMKKDFFQRKEKILDQIALDTCQKLWKNQEKDLCFRLTANIYHKKVWGENDLDHVRFLYNLAKEALKESSQESKFGVICLQTAYEHALSGSKEKQEIYQWILCYLYQDKRNELLEKKIWKYVIPVDQNIFFIGKKLSEKSYSEGLNLLKGLENDNLSLQQKERLATSLRLPIQTAFEKGSHAQGIELLGFLCRYSSSITELEGLNLEKPLLGSYSGCIALIKILENPQLNKVFGSLEHIFLKQVQCLTVLREKFKEKNSPIITNLLIKLLQKLQENQTTLAFENFSVSIFKVLREIDLTEPVRNQLQKILPLVFSWYKEKSRITELMQLFDWMEQNKTEIQISEEALDDYLWSLKKHTSSSLVMGKFFIKYPLKKYKEQVEEIVKKLQVDPSHVDSIFHLIKAYDIKTKELYLFMLEYLPPQQEQWDAFLATSLEEQWISSDQEAYYREKKIRALINFKSPKLLYYLDDLDNLEQVFCSYPQKINIYMALLEESIGLTKKNSLSHGDLSLIAFDKLVLSLVTAEGTDLQIKKKLYKSTGLNILKKFGEVLLKISPEYLIKRLKYCLEESKDDNEREKNKFFKPFLLNLLVPLLKIGQAQKELRKGVRELFRLTHDHFRASAPLSEILWNGSTNVSQESFIWKIIADYVAKEKFLFRTVENKDAQLFFRYFEFRFSKQDALDDVLIFSDFICILSKIRGHELFPFPCFERIMELAIKNSERKGRFDETLALLYLKISAYILDLDPTGKRYTSAFEFWENLVLKMLSFHEKAKQLWKLDKTRFLNFYHFNKMIYTKFIQLNRIQHDQNWSEEDVSTPNFEWKPSHVIMQLWLSIHSFFCSTYLSEYHKEIYPLLPLFYFKRLIWLESNPMTENERIILEGIFHIGNFMKYKINLMEIGFYAEGLLNSTFVQGNSKKNVQELKEFFEAYIKKVDTPNRLQMFLYLINKAHFEDDLLVFLKLHLSVLDTLAKDPFFWEEKYGSCLSFLFSKNIVNGSKTRELGWGLEKLNQAISMLINFADNFNNLFESYTIEEQLKGMKSHFVILSCDLLDAACNIANSSVYPFSCIEDSVYDAYFGSVSKILELCSKNKISDPNINYEQMYNVIINFPGKEGKTLQGEVFLKWIQDMQANDKSGNLALKYFDLASKGGFIGL